jgi:hypothetical protein
MRILCHRRGHGGKPLFVVLRTQQYSSASTKPATLNPKPDTKTLLHLLLQVILVSASLRATSIQTAKAWVESDPISVRSEAPSDTTPAARAAAAAAAAAAEGREVEDGEVLGQLDRSQWAQMLPDTIKHQVGVNSFCFLGLAHCRDG